MIRHAITGAVGVVVLGAALAMAQAADPPRPTQLTKTGVAGWCQAAGIEPGRDARDARDARTRGLPGRPGPVNRLY